MILSYASTCLAYSDLIVVAFLEPDFLRVPVLREPGRVAEFDAFLLPLTIAAVVGFIPFFYLIDDDCVGSYACYEV